MTHRRWFWLIVALFGHSFFWWLGFVEAPLGDRGVWKWNSLAVAMMGLVVAIVATCVEARAARRKDAKARPWGRALLRIAVLAAVPLAFLGVAVVMKAVNQTGWRSFL